MGLCFSRRRGVSIFSYLVEKDVILEWWSGFCGVKLGLLREEYLQADSDALLMITIIRVENRQ